MSLGSLALFSISKSIWYIGMGIGPLIRMTESGIIFVPKICDTFMILYILYWFFLMRHISVQSNHLQALYCGYTHTHWMFALTSKGPSLLWTEWRARLMWYHAHALNVSVDREGPVAALDGMKSEAVSTGRWADRFVLVAVTRHERSRSEPARAVASWCRPVVTCSFRWEVLLDQFVI
jgi:hypothetical protein